jgi:hypothetical protein
MKDKIKEMIKLGLTARQMAEDLDCPLFVVLKIIDDIQYE